MTSPASTRRSTHSLNEIAGYFDATDGRIDTFEESECTQATPGKFLRSYDMVIR